MKTGTDDISKNHKLMILEENPKLESTCKSTFTVYIINLSCKHNSNFQLFEKFLFQLN